MAYIAPKTLTRARNLIRKLTDAEAILWHRFRRLPTLRFRRQHPVGPFIADFACIRAKLIVEADGATHGSETERAYDRRREAYLRTLGWQVVRVSNIDIYENSDAVVAMICDLAERQIKDGKRGFI